MGKVRPASVKRLARELLAQQGDRFTTSFEENKEALRELLALPSKKLRNRVAGYITRLMVIRSRAMAAPAEAEAS